MADVLIHVRQERPVADRILPARVFIEKLAIVNERRVKFVLPSAFGSPLVSIDQVGKYYDAALAVEWPSGWQP